MSSPKHAKAAAFMRKAIQYFEAGDLAKAQKNVAKYLSIDPGNADANHLAGLMATQTGKPEKAILLLTRALQANPRMAMAHNNLGEAYRALEQFVEAETCYRKAIALEPHVSGFHNNLGTVVMAQGRAGDAIAAYQTALKGNPRDVMALTNLGNALLDIDDIDGAIKAHETALKLDPSSAEAQTNLGVAQLALGDMDGARRNFEAVLARHSKHVLAMRQLAGILKNLGQQDDAMTIMERVIMIDPDDRVSYIDLADMYRFANKPDAAIEVFERYLERVPSDLDARVNIGSTWRAAGEKEKAQDYLRKSLEIDPKHAATRVVLAQMTKHEAGDENINGLEELRKDETLPLSKRTSVNFGLGKVREDLRDYDGAIDCFVDANRFKREELPFSIEASEEEFAKMKAAFPSSAFTNADDGCQEPTSIFILGMPRSGTSLVEQIISSHSQVYGAGELMTLTQTIKRIFANSGLRFPEEFATAEKTLPSEIGRTYDALLRTEFGNATRITDKMPHNFFNVGLIRLALPNAKVVHCNRHPMDTCLSIFKHAFADGHPYSYGMEDLGLYYRQYLDLMEHWRSVIPGFMYENSYETLVDDTEGEARRLLEFCDLEWEPACLEFYKTKRVVNTISASQVRQPIYKDSVALWKRYGAGLQPLIDALGDAMPVSEI